jgi:hypothetical protein
MSLFIPPNARATDANNAALSGAKWYFYSTGTSALATIYADSDLSTPSTNPATADAGGKFDPIYLDPAVVYRAVLKTSAGSTISDVDPYDQGVSQSSLARSVASGGIGYLADLEDAVARTVEDKLQENLSLLDVLTDEERDDVESGTNAIDITDKFALWLIDINDNHPYAIADATAWNGVVDWSDNPFYNAGSPRAELKVRLRTSNVTFRLPVDEDGVATSLIHPSHMEWDGGGTTQIIAQDAIENTTLSNSPAKALYTTTVRSEYCTGTSGQFTVTLNANANDIVVGAPFAIIGILDYDYISHTLNGGINDSVMSLTLATAADVGKTIGGSLVYLKIGSEIIRGTVNGSYSGSTGVVTVNTDTQVVTLADALPRSFTNAIWLCGSVGGSVSGVTIDGGWEEGDPLADNWLCMAAILADGFTGRDLEFKNAPHGGFISYGSRRLDIHAKLIENCGRPDAVPALGACLWDFGSSASNRYRIDMMDGGNLGVAIDNKSFGTPEWLLIGEPDGIMVEIGEMRNIATVSNITGAVNSSIIVRKAGPGVAGPVFEDSAAASALQTTSSAPSENNIVIVHAAVDAISASGSMLPDNRFVLSGAVSGRSASGTWTDGAGRTITFLNGTTATFTATGAKAGDRVHVQEGVGCVLPASVGFKAASLADDQIEVTFLNCENSSHVMTAGQIKLDWYAERP